jgi:hypothetical protein
MCYVQLSFLPQYSVQDIRDLSSFNIVMMFDMSTAFQNVRIGFVPKLVVALILSHLFQ